MLYFMLNVMGVMPYFTHMVHAKFMNKIYWQATQNVHYNTVVDNNVSICSYKLRYGI